MKNFKRVMTWMLALVFVLSLFGCGAAPAKVETAKEEPKAAEKAAEKPAEKAAEKPAEKAAELVVAGVVFQEDQFMKLLSIGYADAAKAAGVKFLAGNTSNYQAKEVELINTYVAQKVSGLAIAPLDPKTSEPTLKKANDSGMKISITNMDLSSAPYIVGGYTSDSFNIGQITGAAAAKFIAEKMGGKANIAILQFKSQVPAQSKARVDGFLGEVSKLPGVKVVADQDAWLQDKAVAVAGDMLTANGKIDLFFAANDGGTIGATMAIKNCGKAGKCFVFGIDTGEQQIAMLKSSDNILQGITGQDPYGMGFKAMETLIKGLKGGDVSATTGKTVIVPGTLLSRADPDGITKFEADLKAKMGK